MGGLESIFYCRLKFDILRSSILNQYDLNPVKAVPALLCWLHLKDVVWVNEAAL